MKRDIAQLAMFGHKPEFDFPLPVGQINLPEEKRFREIFHEIFQRRHYTNHGILAEKLEDALRDIFGTRHVLVMTNATIALNIACKALGLPAGGKVVVPAFTFAATVQALTWAGLVPVFCDVNSRTHTLTGELAAALAKKEGACAVLGVHLWGNPCDINGLSDIAGEQGIHLIFDSAHAVGCTFKGNKIGQFGACEVFSFHGTKILSATEGGCITTNDDELAEVLRNLRSSYGTRKNVPTAIGGYGRFSEAQAAMALLSLENFPANRALNRKKLELYHKELSGIPGIRFLMPAPGENHNCQYVVLEIDQNAFGLSRDELVRVLEAENVHARRYFIPGMHRCVPYRDLFPQFVDALPVTDALCAKVMQLPSGHSVTAEHIGSICGLIRFIHCRADAIRGRM